MTSKKYVIGDVDRVSDRITFDMIEIKESETPTRYYGDTHVYGDKKRMRIVFHRPDDCSRFFDILTMGISRIEEVVNSE